MKDGLIKTQSSVIVFLVDLNTLKCLNVKVFFFPITAPCVVFIFQWLQRCEHLFALANVSVTGHSCDPESVCLTYLFIFSYHLLKSLTLGRALECI